MPEMIPVGIVGAGGNTRAKHIPGLQKIDGAEPIRLTTFAEGVRYMEFTETVAISADRGRAVSLPLTY